MQAGRLNEPITIERQYWIESEYGSSKIEKWEKYKDTRAAVKYLSGARIDENNELFFGEQVIFEIRIYHDIRNLDRIVWKNETYRIMDIEYDRAVQRKIVKTQLWNS